MKHHAAAAARTIAPHDKLDDAPYALVVQALDSTAARDAATSIYCAGSLRSRSWIRDSRRVRARCHTEIGRGHSFLKSCEHTLMTLYASPLVFAYLVTRVRPSRRADICCALQRPALAARGALADAARLRHGSG